MCYRTLYIAVWDMGGGNMVITSSWFKSSKNLTELFNISETYFPLREPVQTGKLIFPRH